MSDPQRRARAFENGLIGQARPSAEVVLAEQKAALPSTGCNLPPGEPCDPPPPPPSVSARTTAVDTVLVTYTCGEGATTLVRVSPNFTALPTDCFHHVTADTGLTPGTTYCYAILNDDGSLATGTPCATTPFAPYLFNGPAISQAESDQMAATFDWTHTSPVAATIDTSSGTQTALYSMNILVKNSEDLVSIRGLGIHTQTQPLLNDEQAAWDGTIMKAMAQDRPVGVWITAIVPGPVYNDIRSQAIAGIANGQPIGIRAMAFRRINLFGAAFYPNTTIVPVSPLDPTFLGQQGLEFNGYSAVQCDNGTPRTCTVQQALLGWLAKEFITIAVDIVEAVVDAVREIIGAVEKLVRGEVDVTVQLVLDNTDEAFGTGEPARSGWNNGSPLLLKNLTVRVYQGVAEFTGTSDDNGTATVKVSKNLSGKVCIDLDNPRLTIIDTFTPRRVCIGGFSATSSATTVTVTTTNEYANELAAMTDVADYLKAVMGLDMAKISVLTGWQSALITAFNTGLSFTPCMGRMPNLAANLSIYGDALVSPLVTALGEISEFVTSYDIILERDDVRSRGIGVHEYGHAAMCELLRQASEVKASQAWADVMVGSLTGQSASSQQAVIAEGFADFIALQAAGGTDYVVGKGTQTSRSIAYCLGDSPIQENCLEGNALRCDGSSCAFTTNVLWAVSLLQDTFDRIPTDAADRANPSVNLPNDGSHWSFDGTKLVPHHASNQVSATDMDTIQLAGPSISHIFSAWADRDSVLQYDSFFGGLAQALKGDGFDVTAACAMFAAHEPGGTCPGYVIDVFGAPPPPIERFAYAWADQPSAASYQPDASYAYNGAGGGVSIDRVGTGRYAVTFNGLPAFGPSLAGSVAVTAYGSSTITCSVAGFGATAESSDVDVLCWDNASAAAADSRFSIMVLGDSVMPAPSAFLSSGGPAPVPPPSALLSWTSGGHPEIVTHNGAAGDYNVNLGVGNAQLSAKLVSAIGTGGGERCNNAQSISAGLEVTCFDRSGAPADEMFYTVQVAGGRPGRRFGFAFANQRNSASYVPVSSAAFNSSGGAITITRPSVGHYLVDFAGLQKPVGHTENVQVTAIAQALATCNVVSWNNSSDGLQVAVECRNGAAQFMDSRYEVMVIE